MGKMVSARIHATAMVSTHRATIVGQDVPRARPMVMTTIMIAPATMTSTLALSIYEAYRGVPFGLRYDPENGGLQPPATAGRIETVSPSPTSVSKEPR